MRTAEEVHSSIDSHDVTRSLANSAKELLHARDAWIGTSPPAEEERGVRLPVSDDDEQWLVVGGRKGMSGFDTADVQLLEAIGAIGASALENAHLVSQIRHQATHDRLTSLPNQLLFEDRVNQAVQRARPLREKLAVLMIDLDDFQKVNASLGHAMGNELLKRVGGRLTGAVREGDTVARMSADDFTILLPGIGDGEALGIMAEQLIGAVSRPFVIDGHELFMTASVGIAVYPDDGSHAGQLLRNADTAMHRAKDAGGNCTRLYDPGTNEQAQMHLARRSELHNALRRDELRVLYQPQIDLRTGQIVGVEALVRWEHPTLGLLTPADFVPLAEESDLVVEVDTWVMRHACAQAVQWDAGRAAAAADGREPVGPELLRRSHRRARRDGAAGDRTRARPTRARDHREPGPARVRGRARHRAARPRPRAEVRDRRLRHRLLGPRADAAVPGRPPQDRSHLRQPDHLRAGRRAARVGVHRDRPGAAPRGRRRGRRDPRAADVPAHPRLQGGAGLPLQPSGAARRGRRAGPQAVARPARRGPRRCVDACRVDAALDSLPTSR